MHAHVCTILVTSLFIAYWSVSVFYVYIMFNLLLVISCSCLFTCRLDPSESMVYYDIQPGDVLECRVSHSLLLSPFLPPSLLSLPFIYQTSTVTQNMHNMWQSYPHIKRTHMCVAGLPAEEPDSAVSGVPCPQPYTMCLL